MGEQTIGLLLRGLREQAGRSQSEQADLLSELAKRVVTRNEVSRWESERRLLTPWWQRHYAATFGVPVEQLRRAVAATKSARRREHRTEEPVRRREFIGVMAGFGQPLIDRPASGTRLGASDLDRLYRHTARLRRLDDVLGGADTYELYASQVRATEFLLSDGTYAESIGSGLQSLLAEHRQMAGWAAFDAGHHARARMHYKDSLEAAREAKDDALAGNALAFMAYQETTTQQDGTANARASHETARSVATPRVAALLLERKAFVYAVAGDAQQADLALEQAREALHREDDRPEPDWVFWVDEREIDIMAGRCWTELRRPLRAVSVLESVLADFDDTHGRDKALYLTWLASSYLQAREVEQAAATLARAHDLAAGVASVRPTARITSIAGKLARYRHVPEVSTALEQIGV
ncbi:MAG: helix-turn-helix transcriptional regulator [Pseudonocardiaceae bacterium]